jgi:hypothetical protein
MDNSDNVISKIKPRIHTNGHEENQSGQNNRPAGLFAGRRLHPQRVGFPKPGGYQE